MLSLASPGKGQVWDPVAAESQLTLRLQVLSCGEKLSHHACHLLYEPHSNSALVV